MNRRQLFVAFWTAILLAVPRLALACPVCFGQSDAPLAKATNTGILVMLGVVAAVLVSFAAFFVNLARRAHAAEEAAGLRPSRAAIVRASTTPQERTAEC